MNAEGERQRRTALAAHGVTVVFGRRPTDIPAVRDVSLVVHAGEIVGLTGPSGCGKSTLALALLGLVRTPGHITAGRIAVGDVPDLLALPERLRREIRGRDVALIMQNPRAALHPLYRIGRQIGAVIAAHESISPESAGDRVLELLRRVGIADPRRRFDAFAQELSGGMAQRALIAMALAAAPRLLVADEPTSGLDVTVQAQFLDFMWRSARDRGTGMLLITQEPGILANYCDRVVVMAEGSLRSDQPTAAYFASWPVRTPAVPPIAKQAQSPLLETTGLSRRFPIERGRRFVHAVSDVDLALQPGETLGIVGESGSGKTTVGRCLMGLLEPSGGQVHLRGAALLSETAQAARRQRRGLQLVRQDPFDSLNPRWSIERNLREPLDLHSQLDPAAKRSRIRELLGLVGASADIAAARPRDLGAGMLQRINIARALAAQPDCIILDEPTSMLEPSQRVELMTLLRRLQSEFHTAYVFISHDLASIANLCHRVAVMYLGQIVELGPTHEVFDRPRHPYTRALVDSNLAVDLRRRRVDRPAVAGVAGEIPSPIDLPTGCFLAARCPFVLDRCRDELQSLAVAGAVEVRCWRALAGELPPHLSNENRT